VSAFGYALVHFGVHLTYEGGLEKLGHTLQTIATKPFLITGAISFTILFVLAITSLNSAVRWLGGRKWKNLHRLAYVAAALIAYHQAAAKKIFPVQVLWIYVPLVVLEVARVWKQWRAQPRNAQHSTLNV
jgi:sulfoxide reductase heme-binding subunit YedZ